MLTEEKITVYEKKVRIYFQKQLSVNCNNSTVHSLFVVIQSMTSLTFRCAYHAVALLVMVSAKCFQRSGKNEIFHCRSGTSYKQM